MSGRVRGAVPPERVPDRGQGRRLGARGDRRRSRRSAVCLPQMHGPGRRRTANAAPEDGVRRQILGRGHGRPRVGFLDRLARLCRFARFARRRARLIGHLGRRLLVRRWLGSCLGSFHVGPVPNRSRCNLLPRHCSFLELRPRHPPAQPGGGEIPPEGMGWPLAASFAWTLVISAPRLKLFVHGSWRYTGGFCTLPPCSTAKPE
jgi:hypothetical protein